MIYSNTTLVKVKYYIEIQYLRSFLNSNSTLVKVKLNEMLQENDEFY